MKMFSIFPFFLQVQLI